MFLKSLPSIPRLTIRHSVPALQQIQTAEIPLILLSGSNKSSQRADMAPFNETFLPSAKLFVHIWIINELRKSFCVANVRLMVKEDLGLVQK